MNYERSFRTVRCHFIRQHETELQQNDQMSDKTQNIFTLSPVSLVLYEQIHWTGCTQPLKTHYKSL